MTEATAPCAFIGGSRHAVAEAFESRDPSTGAVIAELPRCGAHEVELAVDAAAEAYEREWRRRPASERSRVLRAIANAIAAEQTSLARLESVDTGKPLSQAQADIAVAARYFDFYASAIESHGGSTIPGRIEHLTYTVNEPYGVTGHIIPWNYPAQISARTLAAALAAGNCCVLKPAEEASLTPLRLGELCLEAGLPAGAANVIPGFGEEVGAALTRHPRVAHLSFTGSREVGVEVATACAQRTVPAILELGGKCPNIVFADADIAKAVPIIVGSILQNCGQTCSAGSRLLVQRELHDQITQLIRDRFANASIGRGVDDPQLGPLISAQQRERVTGFVTAAANESQLLVGGGPPTDPTLQDGYFFEPTLFDRVSPKSEIAREEVFGPVLAVIEFSTTEEAVQLANSTDYGLVAAIWTQTLSTAHLVASELQVGQVFVNAYGAGGGVDLPFGGFKASGYGREKGVEALRSYSQVKTVTVNLG